MLRCYVLQVIDEHATPPQYRRISEGKWHAHLTCMEVNGVATVKQAYLEAGNRDSSTQIQWWDLANALPDDQREEAWWWIAQQQFATGLVEIPLKTISIIVVGACENTHGKELREMGASLCTFFSFLSGPGSSSHSISGNKAKMDMKAVISILAPLAPRPDERKFAIQFIGEGFLTEHVGLQARAQAPTKAIFADIDEFGRMLPFMMPFIDSSLGHHRLLDALIRKVNTADEFKCVKLLLHGLLERYDVHFVQF